VRGKIKESEDVWSTLDGEQTTSTEIQSWAMSLASKISPRYLNEVVRISHAQMSVDISGRYPTTSDAVSRVVGEIFPDVDYRSATWLAQRCSLLVLSISQGAWTRVGSMFCRHCRARTTC